MELIRISRRRIEFDFNRGKEASDRKTLPATARAGSIGIDKLEPLAVEAVGKVEGGAQQVKQTFLVDQDADALVLENLICSLDLVVEVQVVHESGTATALNGNADVMPGTTAFFLAQFDDSISCSVGNGYHGAAVERMLDLLPENSGNTQKVSILTCKDSHL